MEPHETLVIENILQGCINKDFINNSTDLRFLEYDLENF